MHLSQYARQVPWKPSAGLVVLLPFSLIYSSGFSAIFSKTSEKLPVELSRLANVCSGTVDHLVMSVINLETMDVIIPSDN